MAAPLRARAASLVSEALADPGLRAKLEAIGAEPGMLVGDAFGEFLARERDVWSRVIEASGAKAG
jgi:tripartite-type tricarboxylate transporter receptor subunit TctC